MASTAKQASMTSDFDMMDFSLYVLNNLVILYKQLISLRSFGKFPSVSAILSLIVISFDK